MFWTDRNIIVIVVFWSCWNVSELSNSSHQTFTTSLLVSTRAQIGLAIGFLFWFHVYLTNWSLSLSLIHHFRTIMRHFLDSINYTIVTNLNAPFHYYITTQQQLFFVIVSFFDRSLCYMSYICPLHTAWHPARDRPIPPLAEGNWTCLLKLHLRIGI